MQRVIVAAARARLSSQLMRVRANVRACACKRVRTHATRRQRQRAKTIIYTCIFMWKPSERTNDGGDGGTLYISIDV